MSYFSTLKNVSKIFLPRKNFEKKNSIVVKFHYIKNQVKGASPTLNLTFLENFFSHRILRPKIHRELSYPEKNSEKNLDLAYPSRELFGNVSYRQ